MQSTKFVDEYLPFPTLYRFVSILSKAKFPPAQHFSVHAENVLQMGTISPSNDSNSGNVNQEMNQHHHDERNRVAHFHNSNGKDLLVFMWL